MAKNPFIVSKPVRIVSYLAELLGVVDSSVYALKTSGLLKSYAANDVRDFLNKNPVYLARAIARNHGIAPPRKALAAAKPWKTRSWLARRQS